jgi:hypothetical protein
LKKNYKEVDKLRNLSGFGWDDERKLVTAMDAVWEAYLAVSALAYWLFTLQYL